MLQCSDALNYGRTDINHLHLLNVITDCDEKTVLKVYDVSENVRTTAITTIIW